MQLYTPAMQSVSLKGWLADSAAFLILSGPSLNDIDTQMLQRRGIVSMAVNNAWSVVRPMFWTCADPPRSFHDKGWTDPGIIKLVPVELSGHPIATKTDGEFHETDARAFDMPSTFFYPRNAEFNHETFVTEASVNWGTLRNGTPDSLGHSGCRSVLLAAIKLLIYLGVRRIYLVGCDFKMKSGDSYAFDQNKLDSGVRGNNNAYKILGDRFEALLPYLNIEGVEIFNCNATSGLAVFPFIDFEDAIHRESDSFEAEWDISDWYSQQELEESMTLSDRRAREVKKYSSLFEANAKYGHTNHGNKSLPYILGTLNPSSIIDLGCGWNEFAISAKKQGIDVLGVDFACPGADVRAPMHKVPVRRRFDLVTCFDALEHCLTEEITEVVVEMKRLAPKFLISISHVQAKNRGVRGEPLHMTVKKLGWWINQFRRQGAVVIRVPDSNYLLGTWS